MRISVVIDNYNYEAYLADAINSALLQTWPDTEIIVVDDGSTDGSRAVMEFYGTRIIPLLKTNGGQGSALSAAFSRISGDVVIFLDADDTLDSDLVARVASEFIAQPNLARVQWAMQTVDSFGHAAGPVVPSIAMMPNGDLRQHVLRYRTHVWPAMSGNAYSVNALRHVMPIPKEFALGSDLYLAESTAVIGPIRSLPEVGGTYRVHGANHWARTGLDSAYLRQKIAWTMASHDYLRKLCADIGVECPEDATEALDVAFAAQRLASLRLDPDKHPLAGDHRAPLAVRGMWAALRHPHHTLLHKLKRVAWFAGVGWGPDALAKRFIQRFYFRPTGS